jgi:hypothetical protein
VIATATSMSRWCYCTTTATAAIRATISMIALKCLKLHRIVSQVVCNIHSTMCQQQHQLPHISHVLLLQHCLTSPPICLNYQHNSRTGQNDAVATASCTAAPVATVQTSVEVAGTGSDLSADKPIQDGKSPQLPQQLALAQSVVASLKLAPPISLLVSCCTELLHCIIACLTL